MVLVTYNKEYKWLGMKLVTPEKLPSHHFTLEHLSNCILEHFVALNVLNGLMHSTSTVSCTSPVVLNCSLSTLSRPATVCLFHITENKSTVQILKPLPTRLPFQKTPMSHMGNQEQKLAAIMPIRETSHFEGSYVVTIKISLKLNNMVS